MLNWKITSVHFTLFAIFACILGVNFAIKLGGIQLSLYRFILVVTPFIVLLPSYNRLIKFKSSNGYIFIQFLFIWLIYSCIAGIWAVNHIEWFRSLFFLASGVLVSVLVFANINTKDTFFKAIKVVVFLSMALSVLAFYESITGNYYFLNEDDLEWYKEVSLFHKVSFFREPITVFGNPNNYALFLFYSFGFTMLLFLVEQRRIAKLVYVLFMFVIVFLVIITLSRSTLFGIVLFLFSMLYIALFKGSKPIRHRAIFLVMVIGVLIWLLLQQYGYFVDDLFLLEFGNEEASDSIRTNLILNGFVILYNTFFLGTGLGNIEFHMALQKTYNVGEFVNIHNWWMEILCSSGVLIFGLYIWLYGRSFLRLWKGIRFNTDKDMSWLNAVFASVFIGFLISAIGPSSLMGCEWFWPLLALSFKSIYIEDK